MSKRLKYILGGSLAVIILTGAVFYSNQGQKGFLPEGQFTASQILGENYERYIHPDPAFSIEYPKDLKARAYDEGDDAQNIVFQGENRTGFQIFISPYEGEELTQERILEDLPEAIIREPLEALIGPSKDIRALLFWSEDPAIGRTREVWFVHNSYLYEITTYAHLDSWLAGLMTTWRFLD